MRTARKIRYRLEWLGLKSAAKFLPLLSRKACYRLALLLGSLGAILDRRGRRVANSRSEFTNDGKNRRARAWSRWQNPIIMPALLLISRRTNNPSERGWSLGWVSALPPVYRQKNFLFFES